MKSKPNRFLSIPGMGVAALSLGLSPFLSAAALTWDADNVTAGAQDGSGSWTTGSGGWWNGASNVNWTAGDTATFGAGTDATPPALYAISLGGAITTGNGTSGTGGLRFLNTGYAISAATATTLQVGTGSSFLTVASGKFATIGSNVTVTANTAGSALTIDGGGTLNVTGSGAKVQSGNNLLNIVGGTTVNVGTEGTLSAANSQFVIGTNSGGGTLIVDGGTVTSNSTTAAHNLILANNTSGTVEGVLTVNSGSVFFPAVSGGLRFGSSSAGTGTSNGTVNLNGGTLEIARFYEGGGSGNTQNSTVNFNGGTLKVRAGSTNAANYMVVDNAYIKEGGAVIDTNGVATTIGQVLQHGGVAATDGGLTKQGGGSLTLASANSFTGATQISSGGLVAAVDGALGTTAGNTTVAANASLGLSGGISYSSGEKIIGSGVGTTSAIAGTFAAVQRGFIQSVSGNNTFAGDIEINAGGVSRIGAQDGASLNLTGGIFMGSGVSGAQVLFRTGTSGDFVTLSKSGNNWDQNTLIFTGATSGAGGVRLGADNALPTAVSVVAGGGSTGSGTSLDLNGHNQTLNGITTSNGTLHITNNAAATTSVLTLDTTTDQTNFSTVNLTTIEDGAGKVAVVKDGASTQTLVGSHNYTGATTVSAGTLLINGSLGDTAVTVNGGSFGGTGTVGGTLDLAAGSFHVVDLLNPLDVTGTATLYAGFAITDLAGLDWGSVPDGSYTLINGLLGAGVFDSLANNSLATAYDLGGGRSAYFQQGSLDLVVIPEPSSIALLGSLGLVGLIRRRR